MITPVDRPVPAGPVGQRSVGQCSVAGPVADPMRLRPYRIEKVYRELADTFTLVMAPQNPEDRFSYAPGQFTMLYAPGVGEIPISISGDAAHPEGLTQTIRVVGAVSQALCSMRRGEVLGVRGPFGSHWPVKEAEGKDVVIAAGGVGLPPLRPVMYHLLANREQYGNIVLLYGARTPRDLIFVRELEHWRGQLDLEVLITVDRGLDGWRGHIGTVTTLIPRAEFDPQHTVAMVCGPEIMMHFTVLEFKKRNLTDEQIYVSMERNMQCGIGLCGHCQLGPLFVCKDGPVFRFDEIAAWFRKREV